MSDVANAPEIRVTYHVAVVAFVGGESTSGVMVAAVWHSITMSTGAHKIRADARYVA